MNESTNINLVKFENCKDLLTFTSLIAGLKLPMLDPRGIAKLIHYGRVQNDSYRAGFDLTTYEMTKTIYFNFGNFLEDKLNISKSPEHQVLYGFLSESANSSKNVVRDMTRLGKYNVSHHQGVQDIKLSTMENGALIVAQDSQVKLFKTS